MGNYSGAPDESLAQAIDEARLSVDVAIYDLDLSTISNALINAHRRGVLVRVVTDSDNIAGSYNYMTAADKTNDENILSSITLILPYFICRNFNE